MSTRDSERRKTYRAEAFICCTEPKMSRQEAVTFVRRVVRSALWRDLGDKNGVKAPTQIALKYVAQRTKRATAIVWWGMPEIRFPASHDRFLTKGYLCHELAHFVTPHTVPDHGPQFRANMRDLVRRFIGAKEAAALVRNYKAYRLSCRRQNRRAVAQRHTNKALRDELSLCPAMCPVCSKPLITVYQHNNGDRLYVHASVPAEFTYRVTGCYWSVKTGEGILHWTEFVDR